MSKQLRELIDSLFASMPTTSPDAGFALPDATLSFLTSLATSMRCPRGFEFGSGRSTKELLNVGGNVACIEDSEHWLQETVRGIKHEHKERLATLHLGLCTVWHELVPFRGWR